MSEQLSLWIPLAVVAALAASVALLALRRAARSTPTRTPTTRNGNKPRLWAWVLRRRPSRPSRVQPAPARRRVHTRHPVVLAHGWGGVDGPLTAQLGYRYFRGIPEALRDCGHRVHVARVSPTAGIELRAEQLVQQIEQLGTRVNIIAHSMGGLDARLAIARYGLAERVASLTTVGTPHHGTPLADFATMFGEWHKTRLLLRRLGLNVDGVYDVSTSRMREFNRGVPNAPEVQYISVVAAADPDTVHALLCWGHRYMAKVAGRNDGVVPEQSQRWGDTLEEIDADHWAQIGWSGRFDAHSLYNRIVRRLSARDL